MWIFWIFRVERGKRTGVGDLEITSCLLVPENCTLVDVKFKVVVVNDQSETCLLDWRDLESKEWTHPGPRRDGRNIRFYVSDS